MARRTIARAPGEANKILVIVLILFILGAIGEGVAIYYAYADRKKAKAEADEIKAKAEKEKVPFEFQRRWLMFQVALYRGYLGESFFPNEANLKTKYETAGWVTSNDQLTAYAIDPKKFDSPGEGWDNSSPPKQYPDVEEVKKIIKFMNETQANKLAWDKGKKAPNEVFRKLLEEKDATIARLEKSLADEKQNLSMKQLEVAKIDKGRKDDDDQHKKIIGDFKTEFEKKLADKANEIKDLLGRVQKAEDKKDLEAIKPLEAERDKLVGEVKTMTDRLRKLDDQLVQANTRLAELRSKTLREAAERQPSDLSVRGKILRVNSDPRKATIDIGRAHGLTAHTTFAVHGYEKNGKPRLRSKGNIEVINVGEQTSEVLVSAIFHPDPSTDKVTTGERKAIHVLSKDNIDPIVGGDALINPLWNPNSKTHVAIAGLVDLPTIGIVNLNNLIQTLEKQNVIVDAYVDAIDGQIKGRGIGPRTEYLILGTNPTGKEPSGPKDAETLKNYAESLKKLTDEARVGGIPVMTPQRFLRETGFHLPRTVSSD